MKKITSIIMSTLLIISLLIGTMPTMMATSKELDGSDISFTLKCNKPGYEFKIYQISNLEEDSNPYEIKQSVIKSGDASKYTEVETAVNSGDSASLLSALDKMDESDLTLISDGSTFTSEDAEKTYTFDGSKTNNLYNNYGIYYVKATNYPAGVKSVTNSVFSLPYYDKDNGWVYDLGDINLAEKVIDDIPEIKKEITNSTKENVNFTDVSLGDTVNFDITSSTAGSLVFKLNSYVITDDMTKGLTLDKTSFSVKLVDKDLKTVKTLTTSDYTVAYIKDTAGSDSQFTLSLNSSILSGTDFYSASSVVVSYSATLNKYATTAFTGNPNTATKLTYSNKNNVTAEVTGNTVYVYTYGVTVNKTKEDGSALASAQFGIYKTENDAKNETNPLGTGTSDKDGKVEFKNAKDETITLQSGTYYVKELVAPEGYNRYTSVITVTIDAQYGDTLVNDTYITSAPENGITTVNVKNTKTVLPQTGGSGTMLIYIISAGALSLAVILFIVMKKKATNK